MLLALPFAASLLMWTGFKMRLSIRLTEEEQSQARAYARRHALSLAEAFKRALFEKIEDEEDVRIAEEAYAEYQRDPETISHEEVGKRLGLK